MKMKKEIKFVDADNCGGCLIDRQISCLVLKWLVSPAGCPQKWWFGVHIEALDRQENPAKYLYMCTCMSSSRGEKISEFDQVLVVLEQTFEALSQMHLFSGTPCSILL